ncbi:sugar ABC transporter ATP-binding protein [Methylomonas sp. Kb3]|uniref:ABC transporter ATP-binding protein n=1 Tax=Methylomonas sp. Kb3 TaxID=1611544 RepID=UPI000C34AFA3|nr:ABC transporter ATP-binding protein [Methylomonas sp. Kb3]PKD41214.1 sugar ABC transporter ATP-binding protein [Methylomonas sp. Kb3]
MESLPAISVCNVSKKFRLFSSPKQRLIEAIHPFRKQYHKEFWALRNISFDVHRGEIFGILGRNGSGKSTLLQIICAVMQATGGEVKSSGRISALLELGAGFNPEFTGRENVILNGAIQGFSKQEMQERIDDIEAFADIGEFFDQPVKLYSSGMFVRVAFAAAIHIDPEILVVDEALSVGDSKFQHRCFQRIRNFMEQGKTILVVSHSTDTLLRICNRGVVLDRGELVHIGPIAGAVNHYQKLLFGEAQNISKNNGKRKKEMVKGMSEMPKKERADKTDKIPLKPTYNRHETRMGSGKARIVDFDLVVDGELNPPEIASHANCELIVKLVGNEFVQLSVGFAIVSLEGTYVFGTNLAMMGHPPAQIEADGYVVLRFHWQAHLTGGEYFLNLGCNEFVDGQDSFVDVRRSVARLKFSDTPQSVGFVDLQVVPELVAVEIPDEQVV